MKTWKVLLVDDEVEFVSTLAERLGLRDLHVDVANSGEQALSQIEADPPSVVVLDVMMPGMSGFAVLERIKSMHPDIEVILLTGMGAANEGMAGLRQGAFDYLVKPLDLEELIQKIGEAMKKSAGRTRKHDGQ
ncbi:MAG: response regulator [Desulfomonile tiedjei]|uniref:Response regulator n=1 Tax=Desulfomonile tiedjei TaxID=2358 RepID=A0A9D6Z5V5_9BACT|nr:response regulator [Desulfomonile tiedjei]